MAIISKDRIRLNAQAENRSDAIRQAGQLLVDSGCVRADYVDGMLLRETTMSTYLGSGVAIPHGMLDNKEQIISTGISVLQLPQGVEWNPGDEKAHLVIGIAASSDEHINVLAKLAEAVEDESVLNELLNTADPDAVIKYLGE
jgi:phosphocarrier protein FPr